MSLRVVFFSLVGFSLVWAKDSCAHCGEDPICLGSCGYELLLKAEGASEVVRARVYLGKAWVLGDFHEGASQILSEALQEAPSEETALIAEARYWLAQAYQRLRPDSAEYYYRLLRESSATPPYWKAKANLVLSGLYREKNPAKALAWASDALDAAKQSTDVELQVLAHNQLAVLAADSRQYSLALRYAEEALRLARSTQKPRLLSAVLTNLASLYADLGKNQQTIALYQEALQIAPDILSQTHALLNLATYYYQQRKISEVEQILHRIEPNLAKIPFALRKTYYQLRFYVALDRKAYALVPQYLEGMLKDVGKAMQEVETSRAAQLEQLSGLRQRESQLRQIEQQRKQERVFYGVLGLLALVSLVILGYAYRVARRRAQEEAAYSRLIEDLNHKLNNQAHELERQNEELIHISEALTEALEEVQASITAAERLQKALMPPLSNLFPQAAAYYQPLQQVGGDFYVVAADSFSGRYLIAMGDATGHGVAGSILASIFGATIQNFFLQNPRQNPQTLLRRVHNFTSSFLATQGAAGAPLREGCDVAILIFDVAQQSVEVGLAGRPLWVYEPQTGLRELESGRRGLDSFTPLDYEFPSYELALNPSMVFYLFSDGVTDVLNPQGRRWGIKRLRELLLALNEQNLSPTQQIEAILEAHHTWRQEAKSNDDVTILILPAESILARAYIGKSPAPQGHPPNISDPKKT